MNFTEYDLGYLNGGEIIEVTLTGNAANVQLMDNTNFNYYKNGRDFKYYGGHATKSPVRIKVPHAGFWHVTVDLGGYAGNVRSSVRVIK